MEEPIAEVEMQNLETGNAPAGKGLAIGSALSTPEEMHLLAQKFMADMQEIRHAARRQLDVMSVVLGPYICSYTDLLRPWREFLIFEIPDTGPELFSHIEHNLAHFQANYLCIAFIIMLLAISCHPAWLVAVSLVTTAWTVYVAQGGLNPDWKPIVIGVEMTSSHRLTLLYTGSLAMIFIVFGEALLVLVGAIAMLATLHATFHPDPLKGKAMAHAASAARVALAAADRQRQDEVNGHPEFSGSA